MKLLFLLRDQGSDGKMLLLIDNCSSFLLHMMQSDSPADSNSISFDESKALAQALQEKVQLHSAPVILTFQFLFLKFW
jgi:hypothetical protein